jgi:hypothetical protein
MQSLLVENFYADAILMLKQTSGSEKNQRGVLLPKSAASDGDRSRNFPLYNLRLKVKG